MSARQPVIAAGILLAGLWWLLTGTEWTSWLIGVPVVVAAVWASLRLDTLHGVGLSASGALRFLAFFVWESSRGGFDVARRVLAPRLRVAPGFLTYQVALRKPAARLLFANSVSLIPGTLSADLQGQALRVHALDATADVVGELGRLETAVARLFGEALQPLKPLS